MMFGFFINLSGLFSALSAPFVAMGSVAGGVAQQRAAREAQRQAMHQAELRIASMPRVESPPHIPRVKRK